jgi:hypothetical protein
MQSPASSSDIAESAAVVAADAAPWNININRIVAVMLSLALGCIALILFTRGNDFPPAFYHPDEPGKIDQITGNAPWNYHHPLLLLQTVSLLRDALFPTAGERDLAILGRDVSAAFAAISVFAAAMTGYCSAGFAGLLICGLIVMLCPALLINAHYFKEDAALVGGMLLAILGARLVISARTRRQKRLATILLGIACAAAASGKFVGIFTFIPAALTIYLTRRDHPLAKRSAWSIFAISAALTALIINFRAIIHLPDALNGLGFEVQHVVEGHSGLTLNVPNVYPLRIAIRETMTSVWIMLGVAVTWLLLTRRRIGRWRIVVASFPLSYIVLTMVNSIPIPRYALAVTVSIYLLAGLAICEVFRDLSRHRVWASTIAVVCLGVIATFQGERCLALNNSFRDDSRQRLWEFVATQTPPGSRILQDAYVSLHGGGDPWRFPRQSPLRQRIQYRMFAADEGTLDEVVRQGYSYVAVANMNFDRFFESGVRGVRGNEAWFAAHRKFYEDLFAKGELVWESKPGQQSNSYVDMDLRLYKISQLVPPSTQPQDGFLRRLFR